MTSTSAKILFDQKPAKNADTRVVFAIEDGKHGAKLTAGARDLDAKTKGAIKRAVAAADFTGKKAQMLAIPGPEGISAKHIIVAGLGKPSDLGTLCFEKIGSTLAAQLNTRKSAVADVSFPEEEAKASKISADAAAAHLALGALLNTYRFDKYLTKEPKDKKPTLKSVQLTVKDAAKTRKAFSGAQKIAEGAFLTRDLVSEVPNVLYPESFAAIIKKELAPLGIEVKILTDKDMKKLGMGAILAVGQGSARLPRLVSMEYKGGKKGQRPVAFVGKGVTFDTGGISLKPGPGMEEMKWDMAGAGTVVGLMKALASRGAKANVIGIVGLAENMPSGNAYRPGDIVTSMSGQTIEVHNTDAEGRLVLCDALWYVQQKFKPTHIVDLATLTGAVIIALGHEYAGLFSNDDALAWDLVSAGRETGEPAWYMPMNDAWDKAIDSPAADMKNISGGRDAGSAIGAHFLKRFIQDGVKWAHLDIAGVAWSSKDRTGVPKGASSFGVRLLDRYVANNWE
ncbi:MAG: leucyl aminopeptidase [Alphaproteobacteria bacterium]|nr:leucyl aminopeptidase [Alphaproteobacteria bacterium]